MFMYLSHEYIELKRDYDRQTGNVIALNEKVKTYKTKSGQIAKQNSVLMLEKRELKEVLVPALKKDIDDLKIKLRQVQSISQTISNTSDTVYVPIYDTIISSNEALDTLMAFTYNDTFTHISGLINIQERSAEINYNVTDTLLQVVHRGKWRLFKKRQLLQTITCKNPKTSISYSRVITVVK